jgi:hypothetical protein
MARPAVDLDHEALVGPPCVELAMVGPPVDERSRKSVGVEKVTNRCSRTLLIGVTPIAWCFSRTRLSLAVPRRPE